MVAVALLAVFAVVVYAAPWRPAYIKDVTQCNLGTDQICFTVNIRFNSAVDNGTMDILSVALRGDYIPWTNAQVDYNRHVPGDQLGWGVIIPVNGAVISSYTFVFTLLVKGTEVDSRTVGWQGG